MTVYVVFEWLLNIIYLSFAQEV